MIVRNEGLLKNGRPDGETLNGVMAEFLRGLPRLRALRCAYDNDRPILRREREKGLPNNRLAHGFAHYIATVSAGYLLGQPVQYRLGDGGAPERLLRAYRASDTDSVDAELARCAAVYGKGVEILWTDDALSPRCGSVCPENAFAVYSDTVDFKPLFGVCFNELRSAADTVTGCRVTVYTKEEILTYTLASPGGVFPPPDSICRHGFGGVPLIEYWNDEREQGDFEQVQSLIDAYDALESDRVNDKQQFVNAMLVLTGATMGEDELGRTPARQLREDRVLFLPDSDAHAEYLASSLHESEAEILKDALRADIHKFSMVPDMSDVQFAGNCSGVAMKYKLIGLEMLTHIKERWFRQGLRERARRFMHILSLNGGTDSAEDVEIVFTRALPGNELELSQTLINYRGLVPDDILREQIPFCRNDEKHAKREEKA